MTDELVLNDGILWDVDSCRSIHKFDKFNPSISGVFHPNGIEIIINSEVVSLLAQLNNVKFGCDLTLYFYAGINLQATQLGICEMGNDTVFLNSTNTESSKIDS